MAVAVQQLLLLHAIMFLVHVATQNGLTFLIYVAAKKGLTILVHVFLLYSLQ